jgi:hypothetical protein
MGPYHNPTIAGRAECWKNMDDALNELEPAKKFDNSAVSNAMTETNNILTLWPIFGLALAAFAEDFSLFLGWFDPGSASDSSARSEDFNLFAWSNSRSASEFSAVESLGAETFILLFGAGLNPAAIRSSAGACSPWRR